MAAAREDVQFVALAHHIRNEAHGHRTRSRAVCRRPGRSRGGIGAGMAKATCPPRAYSSSTSWTPRSDLKVSVRAYVVFNRQPCVELHGSTGLAARVIGQHAGAGKRQQLVATRSSWASCGEQPLAFALDQAGVQFPAHKAARLANRRARNRHCWRGRRCGPRPALPAGGRWPAARSSPQTISFAIIGCSRG